MTYCCIKFTVECDESLQIIANNDYVPNSCELGTFFSNLVSNNTPGVAVKTWKLSKIFQEKTQGTLNDKHQQKQNVCVGKNRPKTMKKQT